MTVLLGVSVLAMTNVFGQQPETSEAGIPGRATLRVEAPTKVRGGLLYQARIDITAGERISHPTLVLGRAWSEQVQVNTVVPSPTTESSGEGQVIYGYDALSPGRHLTIWVQFQSNPTGPGSRDQSVSLLDGETQIARVSRELMTLP